ncbi:hypothetical protein Bca4012_048691 [Brassica carinata]
MDSPSSIEDSLTEKMIPHYSSLDSFGAMKVYQLVNLESIRVSQAELCQRFMQLPKYLRVAISHCILRKDDSLSSVAAPLDKRRNIDAVRIF